MKHLVVPPEWKEPLTYYFFLLQVLCDPKQHDLTDQVVGDRLVQRELDRAFALLQPANLS